MYEKELSEAVSFFWEKRKSQADNQGAKSGIKDAGNRSSVTGGKQLNGFLKLFGQLLKDQGLSDSAIQYKKTAIPGYFRATKEWDLIVVDKGNLIASIEFKSIVGSFGNNVNNRMEEALGNATDLWTAYRMGAFKPSIRPWLGYFFVLEKDEKSMTPVKTKEPFFPVLREFLGASYKKRFEIFCERLIRERLYDAACLILSDSENGKNGVYEEPNAEMTFAIFAESLKAKVSAYIATQR